MQVIEELVYKLVADSSSLMGDLEKVKSAVQKNADEVGKIYTQSGEKRLTQEQKQVEQGYELRSKMLRKEEEERVKSLARQEAAEKKKAGKWLDVISKERMKQLEQGYELESRLIHKREEDRVKNLAKQEAAEKKMSDRWFDAESKRRLKQKEDDAKQAERNRIEAQKAEELGERLYAKEQQRKEEAHIKDLAKAEENARKADERETRRWQKAELQKEKDEEREARRKEKALADEERRKEKAIRKQEAAEKASAERVKRARLRAEQEVEARRMKMLRAVNALLVTIGIPRFYKNIIKEASNALEANNKLRAVFSDMTDEAEAAAATLTKFYGVSTVNARSMLSDTGNILTNFGIAQKAALQMSLQINKLGVDLASFVNYAGGAAGAANALTKALLGEREAAKALGVAITENDVKNLARFYGLSTTGLDRQQRALLTLKVMLKQTRNAQGDFERSSGDLENQLRILNASFSDLKLVLGEQIVPTIIKMVGALNSMVRTIEEAHPAVHLLMVSLPGLALAIKGVGLSVQFLGTVVRGLTLSSKILAVVTGVSVALGALLTGMSKWQKSLSDFEGSMDKFNKAVDRGNDLLEEKNRLIRANSQLTNEQSDAARKALDLQIALNDKEKLLFASESKETYAKKKESFENDKYYYEQASELYNELVNLETEYLETEEERNRLWEKEDLTEEESARLQELIDIENKAVNVTERRTKAYEEMNKLKDAYLASESEMTIVIQQAASALGDDLDTLELYRKALGDELTDAIADQIKENRELLDTQSDVDAILTAGQYKTKEWASLLEQVTDELKELDMAELEESGHFQELTDLKIANMRKEEQMYLEMIRKRERGIRSELGEGEKLEDNTEWQKLQMDRLELQKYYDKEELYIIKYYSQKKLDAYKDFNSVLQGMHDDLAETDEELLAIEKRDLEDKFKETYELLVSSYGLEDTFYETMADIIIKNGGKLTEVQKKLYEGASDENREFLDKLLDLIGVYYDTVDALDKDFAQKREDKIAEFGKQAKEIADAEVPAYKKSAEALDEFVKSHNEADDPELYNAEYAVLEAQYMKDYTDAVKEADKAYEGFVDSITKKNQSPLFELWDNHDEQMEELDEAMQKELELYEGNEEKKLEVTKKYEELKKDLLKNSIMESTDLTLGFINDSLNQLEGVLNQFSDNSVKAAENTLKEYEAMRDNLNKETKDAGRELTKGEKDELKRREAMLEEQIENQRNLVRDEKRKQFEMQKAFAIAEATITGIQASLNAYNSLSTIPVVGPALGAVAAAAVASMVAGQIAAISSQPIPSYDVGAYNIPEDSHAIVHKGEVILPRPFADEFRQNGGSLGGGDIVVNIYGAGEEASAEVSESEDGKMKQLDIYVSNKVKMMVQRGELDNTLQSRYMLTRNGRKG